MFKEEYQGGSHVEIFTINAREPLKDWKVSDSGSFDKVYEKEAKGFVLLVKGATGTTHIQLPKDPKQNLFLIQPYFVVQVYVPRLSDFYLELTVRDVRGTRRRLFFSGNQKDVAVTALHARLPVSGLQQNTWTNLCVDLPSFVSHCWPTSVFHSVASILVAGTFKLRKVFTLKVPPPPTSTSQSDLESGDVPPLAIEKSHAYEHLPKNCDFPIEVYHVTQLVSIASLQKAISSAPPNSGRGSNVSSVASGNLMFSGVVGSAIPTSGIITSSRTALSAGEKYPEPPPSGKKHGAVRRVVVSGPCGDENGEGLIVSGTSSKSMDTVKSFEGSTARNSSKKQGQSAKPTMRATNKGASTDSGLVLSGKSVEHPPKEPILPYIEPEKRRGSLTDSVVDAIDILNVEMSSHLAVRKITSVPGVVDREDTDVFISNIAAKKSEVPKLPAVRQTYSLVAAEQSAAAVMRTNTALKSGNGLPIKTSTRSDAVALIKRSFGLEGNLSDDDGLTWSMMHDNDDAGPHMNRDFEVSGGALGERPPQKRGYDAKRYVDDEIGEKNPPFEQSENGRVGDATNQEAEGVSSTNVPEVQASVASEQSEVELLFDPVLNCYFDPKTGKYFELI